MVIMGGGGEPNKPTTIFDNELKNASEFVRKSDWNTKVVFNGGHSETEAIAARAAQKSGGQNTHFTQANYEALITEYENKILSGQIRSGDQLLLMISSHGSQTGNGSKTHFISTSSAKKQELANYQTLEGSSLVSLDRLEKLTKLAEQKGIKLGILDFSCYSGVTQQLANSNTCVISSTGPNHFAWGGTPETFASQFTKSMNSGKTLEDVFLEAMRNKRETSFPMISTPLGSEIQDMMYPLITPYLFDTRSSITTDKMKKYYFSQYSEDQCKNLNTDYENLINFTYDIENITANANYTKLRTLITQYNGMLNDIVKNVAAVNQEHKLNETVKFCEKEGLIQSCVHFTKEEILNLKIQDIIDMTRRQSSNSTNQYQKRASETRVKLYQQVQAKQAELLMNSEIRNAISYWDKSGQLKRTEALSNEIAREMQNAYVNAYQTIKKAEGSKGPCAAIKL
jgi:hypothetical protein